MLTPNTSAALNVLLKMGVLHDNIVTETYQWDICLWTHDIGSDAIKNNSWIEQHGRSNQKAAQRRRNRLGTLVELSGS
jgi:hypothetical protein